MTLPDSTTGPTFRKYKNFIDYRTSKNQAKGLASPPPVYALRISGTIEYLTGPFARVYWSVIISTFLDQIIIMFK